jgi:hypothetical protein
MPKVPSSLVYFALAGLGVGLLAYAFLTAPVVDDAQAAGALTLKDIPFDGAAAYKHLEQLCALGPRPSGSAAMARQQELLQKHFEKLGGQVTRQEFRARHPVSGEGVTLANLIVTWHPDRQERILLCAHYDTRPYPDRDRYNPQGTFVGANDGASGVAVLMELGRAMPELNSKLGVDFVLFDGEELVFRESDRYFLGSEHFSREYVRHPPPHRYRCGVLLDMVGDEHLLIFQERNSLKTRETKALVRDIWSTAARLKVREFVARPKHEIRDDHLMLNDIAGIPTCDIIDFDYPYWHTEGDVPKRCSALSLAKVGWVIQEWLKTVK